VAEGLRQRQQRITAVNGFRIISCAAVLAAAGWLAGSLEVATPRPRVSVSPSLSTPLRPPESAAAPRDAKPKQEPAASGRSESTVRFDAGDIFVYRYESRSDAVLAPLDDGLDESHRQSDRLDATLVVRVLRSDHSGSSLWLRLEDGLLVSDSQGALEPEGAATLEVSIEASGVIRLGALGRVDAIEHLHETSQQAKAALRRAAASLQWIQSPEDTGNAWTTWEEDDLGSYRAVYSPSPAAPTESISKTLYYERLHDGLLPGELEIVEGSGEYFVDQLAPMRLAEGGRQTRLQSDAQGLVLSATERFSLELQSRSSSDGFVPPGPDDVAALTAKTSSPTRHSETAPSAGSFGSHLAGLMAYAEALLSSADDPTEANRRATGLLADFLKANPEQAQAVLDWLPGPQSQPGPHGLDGTIVGALVAANTEASQAALLALATSDQWGDAAQLLAIASVLDIERPLPDWDQALAKRFARGDAAGRAALQALGAVAGALPTHDPTAASRRQTILSELRRHARNADAASRATALVALSNAAPSEMLPEIEMGLADRDPVVRSAAVLALSPLHDDAVDVTLLDLLREDPSVLVRLQALHRVVERFGSNAAEALAEQLERDPSPDVRQEILSAMSSFQDLSRPADLEAIARSERIDAEPVNRADTRRLSNPSRWTQKSLGRSAAEEEYELGSDTEATGQRPSPRWSRPPDSPLQPTATFQGVES